MSQKLAVFLYILLTAAAVNAQQFPIQKLGVEEGVGHSIVYRTFQSKDGYLWFSTDNGLTRFDGAHLRNFTTQDGLPTNFIFDLKETDSALIISTFGGGLFTFKESKFAPYSPKTTPLRYPINLAFFQNKIWSVDRYKQLYRESGNTFVPVTPEDFSITTDDFVEAYAVVDADTAAFVTTSAGLFVYENERFTAVRRPEVYRRNVYNAIALRNNHLLLVTKEHLIEYDPISEQVDILFSSKFFSPATCLLEDHEGNLWMSLINGDTYLFRQGAQGEPRHKIKVLEDVVINDIFEDHERNLWLSTYGEGVWCIKSIHVRNYPIRGSILSDVILDSYRDNLLVLTTNSGIKAYGQSNTGFLESATHPLEPLFKMKKNIVAGIETSANEFYFSSDKELYRWSDGRLDSITIPSLVASLHYEEKKRRLWIGCRFGLGYLEGKEVVMIKGFDHRVVKSITGDEEGRVILGTDKGVYIESDSGFLPLPGDHRLDRAYVNALFTEPQTGVTWAATTQGLGRIERGALRSVDIPLTRVRSNSIAGDGKGNLWIGTVSGLLHQRENRYHLITTKEGIAQSIISQVLYEPETDIVTLLTSNGISVLDAHNFMEDARFELPEIIIEQIASGSRSIPPTVSTVELRKGQQDLKVILSTPMVKNRDKISFSYRLNDEGWTEFDGRELSLKALPFGEIRLLIKVHERYRNASNEKLKVLTLFVPKPFYLTWWFTLFIFFIIAATITAVVFSYSRKKNQKLIEENKRLDIEHKALKNLLNPHFLYNAINSIHAFILQNDQRKTLAYLSKFSQLVRLNLELLSADRVTLEKEIKNISLYLEFEKLRFADKLNYHIDIDPLILQAEVEIPSFLIQPFLENAIWHGLLPREQGGNLWLYVEKIADKLIITVEDDGVGINRSMKQPKADLEKKTSMGINIIRDRIELLRKIHPDYALFILDKANAGDETEPTGTVVKIVLPLSRE